MRFLDELELYLQEGKDPFDIYPVDYDTEKGISFGVDLDSSDDNVARVTIKTLDGTPIDALAGGYEYDDVYADVDVEGDIDDPSNSDLVNWVVNKLKNLGYDENTIRVDGEVLYKKPEELDPMDSDELDDESIEPDENTDFYNNLGNNSEESDEEEFEEKSDDESDGDEEESDEESPDGKEKVKKKFLKLKPKSDEEDDDEEDEDSET